jgi:hypothetical protein
MRRKARDTGYRAAGFEAVNVRLGPGILEKSPNVLEQITLLQSYCSFDSDLMERAQF